MRVCTQETIQAEGVTSFIGVPTMWLDLITHPDYESYDTSTLKSIAGGGAAPPKKAGAEIAKKGKAPGQAWGMTETNVRQQRCVVAFRQHRLRRSI